MSQCKVPMRPVIGGGVYLADNRHRYDLSVTERSGDRSVVRRLAGHVDIGAVAPMTVAL
jgi:hypothetical protein